MVKAKGMRALALKEVQLEFEFRAQTLCYLKSL